MTIGGVNVGKADIESAEKHYQKQAINVMGDKTVRARNLEPGYTDYTFVVRRMDLSTKNALVTLMDIYWKWASNPITVVDDDGNSITGNYVAGDLDIRRRAGPFWAASFTIRKYT